MSPENLVRLLCARHGLPAESGAHLLPLVTRALAAPAAVRDRLLRLIDGSLAQRAEAGPEGEAARGDEEALAAVARVLHTWSPSEPLLDLGSGRRRSDEGPQEA